jgi:predicted aspartyl protease
MRGCLLLSAAIVVVATPQLWAGSATPFRLGDQGGVIVSVLLNGTEPFMMLLDTGATHSAITESAAAATGAPAVARAHVSSPAGDTTRAIVAIETLLIGPHTAGHVLPSVVPDGSFDGGAGNIQGLIGQDVLAWLRYTLDFRERRIEWHEHVATVRGTALQLAFEHGRFLVNLPQRNRTLRLVPDSGAGGLVLFNSAGRIGPDVVAAGHTVELFAVQTTRRGRAVRLRELRLGDRKIRDIPAVAIERGQLHPAEGDGLLPLHLFDRVTFDGPARRLILG